MLDYCVSTNQYNKLNNLPLIKTIIHLKDVNYYQQTLGIPVSFIFHHILKHHKLDTLKLSEENCPIIIQSNDLSSLFELQNMKTMIPRVYQASHRTIFQWDWIKTVVHGISTEVDLLYDSSWNGTIFKTDFLKKAKESEMFVIVRNVKEK